MARGHYAQPAPHAYFTVKHEAVTYMEHEPGFALYRVPVGRGGAALWDERQQVAQPF